MSEETHGRGREWFLVVNDILGYLIVAAIIIVPFRYFVAQPFIVSGASMEPTLDQKEFIVIDRLTYRTNDPERGDVVVFRYPLDPDIYFVKRIVGLPGESVTVRDGVIAIKSGEGESVRLDEPYVVFGNTKHEATSITLDEGEYFVAGDNRRASSDSRVWGAVPRENILGRAFLTLYPFNRIEVLPGEHSFN